MSPIYRGTQKIGKIRRGGESFARVYVGSNLVYDNSPAEFAYTVRVTADQVITLPFPVSNVLSINWGDGGTSVLQQHRYTQAGDYRISMVTTNAVPEFSFEADKSLLSIDKMSFNCGSWTSVERFCYGCTNLKTLCTGMFRAAGSANAKGSMMRHGMFADCSSLQSVPEDLFAWLGHNTALENTFYRCTSLKSVPVGLFTPMVNMTSCTYLFFQTGLTAIPVDLLKYCTSLKTISSIFRYCASLESIPADLFKYNTALTSITMCFDGCAKITSVPPTLFSTLANLTGLSYNFNGTSISTIPENLYANNPLITTFGANEFGSTKITAVPQGLFAPLSKLKNVGAVFNDCKQLVTVPSTIFDNNVNIAEIDSLFNGCTALTYCPKIFAMLSKLETLKNVFAATGITAIPEDLFQYNTAVKTFQRVFMSCAGITTVPSNLFRYSPSATNFYGVFSGCTNLTSVPYDPFRYATGQLYLSAVYSGCSKLNRGSGAWFDSSNIGSIEEALAGTAITTTPTVVNSAAKATLTNIGGLFASCKNLTSISSSVFSGMTNVKNAEHLFDGCTELASIPTGLFSPLTSVEKLSYAFAGCVKLQVLPAQLFVPCTKCKDFSFVFYNASIPDMALKTVPTNLFPTTTPENTSVYYAFYRCSNITSEVPALWNNPNITSFSSCYRNCTNAANYAAIPTAWK